MKQWLTLILLLITVIAALSPCCSKDDACCNERFPSAAHDGKQQAAGTCSPFVSCCSCSGFTQTSKVIVIPALLIEKPAHYPQAFSLLLSSYTASILQPPRMV